MATATRSAAQTFALVFGVAYLLVGILGLILAPDSGDELFGVFRLNLLHNLAHLAIGGVLLIIGTRSHETAKRVNVSVGIFYGLLALLGIANVLVGDLLEANVADDFLHLSTAVLAIFFGTTGAEGRTVT
ncbi:MAG TPA: DUF4383 domain-containing protein [Actinomycetota bacterium]|nr:DUF4383 domain-containing protein [Actinomycetota bacterium]